jgi:serine-type D-Ala-D-Ala carboxypeptidase (penicillin-binding protein 5/6)
MTDLRGQVRALVDNPKKNLPSIVLGLFIVFALLFVIGMLVASAGSKDASPKRARTINPNVASTSPQVIEVPREFENLNLLAESAIVWDVRERETVFEHNATERLPLASITKAMTAHTASKYLQKNDIVGISSSAITTEGESGLVEGETFTFGDLLAFMLVISSNDAATAIAEAVENKYPGKRFPELMNEEARSMGLRSTTFSNPSGLDTNEAAGVSGAYGTARDMAILFDYLTREEPEIIEATREASVSIASRGGLTYRASNTNILSSELPGLIGSKTGYTTLAGGNLAAIFDAGLAHPMVMVVLGSSREGRFVDMKNLYNATMRYMERSGTASSAN